jgi:site-specific recombinase XerD
MKKTDFTKATTDYLSHYLPEVRGLSNNTISSYRDTFKQLLTFYAEIKNIPANRMEIRFLTYNNVTSFLEWLEQERKVSISTRNQRQAAVQSFVRYLRYRYPEYLSEYHDILEMKAKKQAKPLIPFLTADELKSLLSQPDANSRSERRNLVMLTTLYDTGARVQELCDLTTDDIRLDKPSKIKLTGKGGKTRQVPIMRDTGRMLKQYMKEYHRFVKKGSPDQSNPPKGTQPECLRPPAFGGSEPCAPPPPVWDASPAPPAAHESSRS